MCAEVVSAKPRVRGIVSMYFFFFFFVVLGFELMAYTLSPSTSPFW
jgi:hypothetical protein